MTVPGFTVRAELRLQPAEELILFAFRKHKVLRPDAGSPSCPVGIDALNSVRVAVLLLEPNDGGRHA